MVMPTSDTGSAWGFSETADKNVVLRKNVVGFIDPGLLLMTRHAGEWAHLGRQRLWIR